MNQKVSRRSRIFAIGLILFASGLGTVLFGARDEAPPPAQVFSAMVSRRSWNPLVFYLAAKSIRPGEKMEDVRIRLERIAKRDCIELTRDKCVLWFHDSPQEIYGLDDDETSSSWILVEGSLERVRTVTFRCFTDPVFFGGRQ